MAQPLHHEHIVRINDPANHSASWLTREQLWAGLKHTVVAPQWFDATIDAALVEEILPSTLRRRIRRGTCSMSDEVELVQNELLRIRADTSGEFAGSTLEIRIEEPAPEMLFVRFTYDIRGLADVRDEDEDRARRSAYVDSDIERIRQTRRYALNPIRSVQ